MLLPAEEVVALGVFVVGCEVLPPQGLEVFLGQFVVRQSLGYLVEAAVDVIVGEAEQLVDGGVLVPVNEPVP